MTEQIEWRAKQPVYGETAAHRDRTRFTKRGLSTIKRGHHNNGCPFHARLCVLTVGDFPGVKIPCRLPQKSPTDEIINRAPPPPPGVYALAKTLCMHGKDLVVHDGVRWIMEILTNQTCTVGWVSRLRRS